MLAVGAAERVLGPLKQVPEALSNAYLPGRFETVEPHDSWTSNKRFILDVAHNDEALVAALDHLSAQSPTEENALVLGLMRRKELFEFPHRVASAVGRVYVVSTDDKDAMEPAELAVKYLDSCFRDSGTDVMLCNKQAVAGVGNDYWMQLIRNLIQPDNPCARVLVTGSHHVVDQFGRRLYAPGEYD